MRKHPVFIDVDSYDTTVEQQGTKSKFWFDQNQQLFKFGKIHGENWAELIACQIAERLQLPHASYEPAYIRQNDVDRYGTVSRNILAKLDERLVNANEFFSITSHNYDQYKSYHQREYTLSKSIALFRHPHLKHLIKASSDYDPIQQFVGYLLFDVLIANTDRHHENWGFISRHDGLYLAPTFDHGSSLACRILPEERATRLRTKDKGYNLEAYAAKAKSAFYSKDGTIIKSHAIADTCLSHLHEFSAFWIEKIANISRGEIESIVDAMPNDWMTELEKTFTIAFLINNQNVLMKKLANV